MKVNKCCNKTIIYCLFLLFSILFFNNVNSQSGGKIDELMDEGHEIDLKAGRLSIESSLRTLENHRIREVMKNIKNAGYNIQGFYHTSKWRGGHEWKVVIEEQLMLLDGKRFQLNKIYDYDKFRGIEEFKWGKKRWASLLDLSDNLLTVIAGNSINDYNDIMEFIDTLPLKYKDKISFRYNQTIDRGEGPGNVIKPENPSNLY
jgi:hypothetical protein